MNISQLLHAEIQDYINKNSGVSVSKLALQKNPFPEVDFKIILNQIEAKSKAKEKLPTWFSAQNIIYPSKISVEQTSSEQTAKFKSQLLSGNSLIDLTGGFGVDDFYFSKTIKKVVHCEMNEELHQIVSHNLKELQVSNIETLFGDSTEILKNLNHNFDFIYIDPSRRSDTKGKVFMLKDCLPNVVNLQEFYFQYSDKILIKTAPILDISAGLLELENVKNIHIIAVENEVKELLWEIEKQYDSDITIKTVNITKDKNETFDFILSSEKSSSFSLPQKYLYEPNSAIMKSGGFSEIGNKYNLDKLHQHSHIYTSDEKKDFPGRIFEVQNIIPYSKKEMKEFLENTKANITTRNFPETVENIRKKWKIKDGGNVYCFFTIDKNENKIVLICNKIELSK
jgi:16S rRNA G966 N2-methylase RsmD